MLRELKTSGWKAFRDRAKIFEITMLVGEKLEDFEDLLKSHYEEWTPDGTTEEYLTLEIAKLRWQRDRCERSQQLLMDLRQHDFVTCNRLAHELRKLKSLVPEFQAAKNEDDVEKVLSKVEEFAANSVRKKWPLESSGSERWGSEIAKGLARLPNFILGINRTEQMLKLEEEFPVLDRLHKLEQFDLKIARTIKHLMQVKTMKQMHRQLEPKLIPTSRIKSIGAS
jgi:hypothetical protein